MTLSRIDLIGRWLLPAALFMVVLPLYLGLLPWAFDDAYIHLRMAANLAAGEGPFVNPGQPVNAGSAPAWTLLLALLASVGAKAPLWVGVVNAIATVLGAALYVELVGRLTGRPLGVGYRLLFAGAYCGVLQYSGAGLMETPVALLCLGLGLLASMEDRPVAGGLLLLACFLRLELAAIAGLILLDSLVAHRESRLRTLVWSVAAAAPLLAYQLYFFGSMIPHTAQVKLRVYELTFSQAFGLLAAFAAPASFDRTAIRIVCLAGLLTALAAGIFVRSGAARGFDGRRLSLLAAGTVTIPLVYVFTGTLVFPWYPPLFVIPALLLLVSIARRASRAWVLIVVAICGLAPYALDLAPSLRALLSGEVQRYRYFAVNARVRTYLQLGEQLSQDYPGARLLSSEIGGLGYSFTGEIVDALGLASPRALEFHPMKVPEQRRSGMFGAIPAAFVESERPELIVSMEPFLEEFVRSTAAAGYRRYSVPLYVAADRLPGAPSTLWGARSMSVFVRRDLPEWSGGGDRP